MGNKIVSQMLYTRQPWTLFNIKKMAFCYGDQKVDKTQFPGPTPCMFKGELWECPFHSALHGRKCAHCWYFLYFIMIRCWLVLACHSRLPPPNYSILFYWCLPQTLKKFTTLSSLCTVSCHNDKLHQHQWWQSCQIDDLLFSVKNVNI